MEVYEDFFLFLNLCWIYTANLWAPMNSKVFSETTANFSLYSWASLICCHPSTKWKKKNSKKIFCFPFFQNVYHVGECIAILNFPWIVSFSKWCQISIRLYHSHSWRCPRSSYCSTGPFFSIFFGLILLYIMC